MDWRVPVASPDVHCLSCPLSQTFAIGRAAVKVRPMSALENPGRFFALAGLLRRRNRRLAAIPEASEPSSHPDGCCCNEPRMRAGTSSRCLSVATSVSRQDREAWLRRIRRSISGFFEGFRSIRDLSGIRSG